MTVCVCSARPECVATNVHAWRAALGAYDELLLVLDGLPPGERDIGARAARVVTTGRARGLSAARSVGLREARSPRVVFLDDDAVVSRETLESMRRAFDDGAQAVGVRLIAQFERSRPKYMTDGLLHYVGVHVARTYGSVWGACFGVERDFAHAHGIAFRTDLGRRGRQLQSGDDTTFVRQVRDCGGRVTFLAGSTATHQVSNHKLSLAYLLRRAWWQGRSEVRRDDALRGVIKELERLFHGSRAPVRAVVVLVFGSAVTAGAAFELVARRMPQPESRGR
jgi:GT2 family glycosyltransferase